MAHNVEPMDIDQIDSDFDNKENSVHHNNVYPRTPCTEKGYEELDVSELNMKLRYSMTPISTPMSKSYTANSADNKVLESGDTTPNANLTRSFNSAIAKNDIINKCVKSLPLQTMSTDHFHDNNRNTSVLRPIDSTAVITKANTTVSVIEPNDIDENLSIPSSVSSNGHTPEATTPTKEITSDGGSPIMRGLKTVLNMFRSSQSPIPPETETLVGAQVLNPPDLTISKNVSASDSVLASTPIANKNREGNVSKRSSPLKENIVFMEDLERELLWKDESTVLFNEEKIPIHKLLFQQPLPNISGVSKPNDDKTNDDANSTIEYMEISYNNTLQNKTVTDINIEDVSNVAESDSEFVDCETTFNNKFETSCSDHKINSTIEAAKADILRNAPVDTTVENNGTFDVHISQAEEIIAVPSDITQILEQDFTNSTDRIFDSNEIDLKSTLSTEIIDDKRKENGIEIEHTLTKTDKIIEENIICVKSSSTTDKVAENLKTDLVDDYEFNKKIQLENINVQPVIDVSNINTLAALTTSEVATTKETHLVFETTSSNDKHISSAEEDKNKSIDDNQELPANIPLPDEDETENNLDETNSIISDVKLESTRNIDNLPNEFIIQAKSIELNKTVTESVTIDTLNYCNFQDEVKHSLLNESMNNVESLQLHNVSTALSTKVEIVEQKSLSTTETNRNEQGDSVVPHNILREGLLTDIDNIISKAQTYVNLQQQKLIVNNSQVDAPFEKHSEENELIENKVFDDKSSGQSKIVNLGKENLFELEENEFPKNSFINTDVAEKNLSKVEDNQCHMSIDDYTITLNQKDVSGTENDFKDTVYGPSKDNIAPELTESSTIPDMHCKEKIESLSSRLNETVSEVPKNISGVLKTEISVDQIILPNLEGSIHDKAIAKLCKTEDNVDVEIILSADNSPYISIDHEIEENQTHPTQVDTIVNANTNETEISMSPLISPKIVSKGYNFNFDEIDDPFATKTKIRMSPPLDISKCMFSMEKPSKSMDKHRRKSQPERKKPFSVKKSMNTTFAGSTDIKEVNTVKPPVLDMVQNCTDLKDNHPLVYEDSKLPNTSESVYNAIATTNIEPYQSTERKPIACANTEHNTNNEAEKYDEVNKANNEIITLTTEDMKSSVISLTQSMEVKNTSSSEQSTYYSAGTSGENSISKNVFNIPEIDDMNFNPFITKSKMCQSPPPEKLSNENSFQLNESTQKFTESVKDKLVTAFEEKECINSSNTTCSSKSTDEKNITVQEVFTEDEDTIEGPFLEAEDLNDVDKISNFDDNDLMMFSELPKEGNEDNLDGGELFIDAEAFEFLLNQNQSNAVADSAKESLFLKFDPLFAKRVSSDGVLSVLKKVKKRQSTPKKPAAAQQINSTFEKPIPGSSNSITNHEINATVEESMDELNITVTKPMMVVTPAVNPVVTPRNKTTTPTSSNRRSITFTSPAIAVIDRLLCMSGNNSMLVDSTVTEVNREQNEAELALTQLRELLADKEIHVYNLRSETKELRDRLTNLESQMRMLESESEERLKKVNELNEKLNEKTKLNKSMAAVVEEYERTIASLIAETEQDRKRHNEERIKLIQERDEQTAHLTSMEVSFNDLHSKYEKSKQIILSCKANEDAYKKSIKQFEDNVTKMQANYELLKQHATSKLNHANQELEKMNRTHESEVLKLNAMIKRKDLHITSLEETLAQKTKANEELAAICDELINKVG